MRLVVCRAALVAATLGASAALAGCTGPSDDGSTSGDAQVAVTTQPAPSGDAHPVATQDSDTELAGSVPPEWTPDPGLKDSVAEAPEVEAALGAWHVGGAEVTVATAPAEPAHTDPRSYFEARYGQLSVEDGLVVTEEITNTVHGAPLLIVDFEPTAGQGGDAQSIFVAFGQSIDTHGAITYDGALDAERRAEFVAVAATVEVDQ